MSQDEPTRQALPHYRVTQLHSPQRGNQPVTDLEGLVTHHPGSNARARVDDGVPVGVENPRTRSYGVVGGEIQELETRRTDGGTASALGEHQVLLTKDFMLEDSRIPIGGRGVREVDVPSPFAGYVQRVSPALGTVDIYDRQGGELKARILHMDPVHVSSGDTIEYGQALGTQSNQGLPTAGKHVHMEVDTRYYQEYENYVEDLASGRLAIDPERRNAGIEPRPVVDDGIIRVGEAGDIVRVVQQRLNAEGYTGADNRPLAEDGIYRLSMQRAVINYQNASGLPATGDLDPATVRTIAPPLLPPGVNPQGPADLPPYVQPFGRWEEDFLRRAEDPLLAQARHAVHRLDASIGREYDGYSECMAASVACLAKANGFNRIDHVVLSQATAAARPGENVFIVQGEPGDPSHRRAHMATADALSAPADDSIRRLQENALGSAAFDQHHEQAEQLVQQEQLRVRAMG